MGFGTIALNHTITGKVTGEIANEIPKPLPFPTPQCMRILRRCTLVLSDTSQNHRLSSLGTTYDILALRPTDEKSLVQACNNLECDLISLDLCMRFPYHFKHTTLGNALQRGVRFEICYAPGLFGSDGGASKRNLISNATQLIRATRGRGIIISSDAKRALGCRGPADIANMAVLWGLGQERGIEAVAREARNVVAQAEMKRRSFRGVIDVIYGGEKPEEAIKEAKAKKMDKGSGKRKATALDEKNIEETVQSKPVSKREQKKQAKKARLDNVNEKVYQLGHS